MVINNYKNIYTKPSYFHNLLEFQTILHKVIDDRTKLRSRLGLTSYIFNKNLKLICLFKIKYKIEMALFTISKKSNLKFRKPNKASLD